MMARYELVVYFKWLDFGFICETDGLWAWEKGTGGALALLRTEGVGHKPGAPHTSWGATRRQRYSGARSEGAPLLTRLGAAADSQFGSVATRGKGRWLAAYLQATTTRHRRVSSLLSAQPS